jgi:hypothetical protein
MRRLGLAAEAGKPADLGYAGRGWKRFKRSEQGTPEAVSCVDATREG